MATAAIVAAAPAVAAPAPVQANDADSKTPQSIAIVAGRKYIMVPKTSDTTSNGVETVKSS